MNPNQLTLVDTFIRTHTREAAREIENCPIDSSTALLQALPLSHGRRLISSMIPLHAAKICAKLPLENTAALLSQSNADNICAILRCLNKPLRINILKQLPQSTSTLCKLRLNYSQDTVGAWMNADVNMLPLDITTEQAIERLAQQECTTQNQVIPVINANLLFSGAVQALDLLTARKDTVLKHIVKNNIPCISSRARLSAISIHPAWDEHDVLIVLGRKKQFVGLLPHNGLRQGLKQAYAHEREHTSRDSNVLLDVLGCYANTLESVVKLAGEPIGRFSHRSSNYE